MATSTSDSTDSSPLLKLSGERAALLHEDELTPKSLSPHSSESFSTEKVILHSYIIIVNKLVCMGSCKLLLRLHVSMASTSNTYTRTTITCHTYTLPLLHITPTLHTHTSQPLVFSDPSFYVQPRALPLWRKLAYAVGAMPYSMCNTVVGFYLNIFLLEVAIVSGTIGGVCITALILHNSATFPTLWPSLCTST